MAGKTTMTTAELLAEDADIFKYDNIIEVVDHLTSLHGYSWLVGQDFTPSAKNLAHMNQLHEMAHNESEGYC